MIIRKAFKFEIMPNGETSRKIIQFCGCSRFVFNKALNYQNEQYKLDNNFKFNFFALNKNLPIWKNELTWLKQCHSQVLQSSLKDLESSFKNFFAKRAKFPKFQKKGIKNSFRFQQGVKLEEFNNRVYLPKIGWVKYRNSRKIIGTIKNMTVSIKCGKFYISIQTQYEQKNTYPNGGEIGIDMGISRFATLSCGKYFKPINSFKNNKGKLAKIQKQLKNKKKFSKNWLKNKNKISKLHYYIANCRKDYLHKISSHISQNHAIVYIEDLKISNMSKSAKGTAEKHGKNVKAKSGLNRAILDQGWFEFRRQLEYKLSWNGGHLIAVPPHNTSRKCIACGHTDKANRLTQESFKCVNCGYSENADLVGAINVLHKGQDIMKQSGQDMSVELVK